MAILESLRFVSTPQAFPRDPASHRRALLISRIEQQSALIRDASFAVSSKRWVTGDDGTKTLTEFQRRVKPWWKRTNEGKYVLSVRYGYHRIEFEPGKSGIDLSSLDAVSDALVKLAEATAAGELDSMIEKVMQRSGQRPPKARTNAARPAAK
jgi:hypothetical protein